MTTIAEVEESIKYAEEFVKIGDKAIKLSSNKDFKELVLEGYLRDEASRLALLSADFSLPEETRKEVITMIQGISCFASYMRKLVNQGKLAASDIAQHRETLQELYNEE